MASFDEVAMGKHFQLTQENIALRAENAALKAKLERAREAMMKLAWSNSNEVAALARATLGATKP